MRLLLVTVAALTTLLFAACSPGRSPSPTALLAERVEPATLEMVRAAGDRALLTVVLRPQRWRAASRTLAPLLTGVDRLLDRFIEADDFAGAVMVPFIDGAHPDLRLEGLDETRPIVAALFEPQNNPTLEAVRLPVPTTRLLSRQGVPGVRHRLLLPAREPDRLIASLENILGSLEFVPELEDDTVKLYRLDGNRGFAAIIPPQGGGGRQVVRIELLTGDGIPYPDDDARRAAWRELLAAPPGPWQGPVTPALVQALAGSELLALYLRSWLLEELAVQLAAGRMLNALQYADASYRQALLAQGLSEIAGAALLMSPLGAEADDLAFTLDLDAGLQASFTLSLTELGRRVVAAALDSAPPERLPVAGANLARLWSRFDFNTALQQARKPEDLAHLEKLADLSEAIQECGVFCIWHFAARAPFGLLKAVAALAPGRLVGQLPQALALVIEGVDLSGGYPLRFATQIRFPRQADTAAMKDFLAPRLRRAVINIEPLAVGQRFQVSLGSDPDRLLRPPAKGSAPEPRLLGEMELRLDLLSRRLPASATRVVRVLGQLGSLRARTLLAGRALAGQLRIELAGSSPAADFAPPAAGPAEWPSPDLAAASTPGAACLRQATREMRRGLQALAYADPATRPELIAKMADTVYRPLDCAQAQPDTRERAAAMKEALAGWVSEVEPPAVKAPPPEKRSPPPGLAEVGGQDGVSPGAVIGNRPATTPRSGPAPKGVLAKEQIQQVIRNNSARLRYCYEKKLLENPNLAGTVKVAFTVAADGRVSQARAAASDTGDAAFDKCVIGVVEQMVFPKPAGGGVVKITYPFKFESNR